MTKRYEVFKPHVVGDPRVGFSVLDRTKVCEIEVVADELQEASIIKALASYEVVPSDAVKHVWKYSVEVSDHGFEVIHSDFGVPVAYLVPMGDDL